VVHSKKSTFQTKIWKK